MVKEVKVKGRWSHKRAPVRRRTAARTRVKQSVRDFLREWGMPPYIVKMGRKGLRYRQPLEKGVCWYWFSRFIRLRDIKKYGKCISCGKAITEETCDCGHFMPAGSCGPALLMDEVNNNAECSNCNAWDETHLFGYAEGLDERYGAGTAQRLQDERAAYLKGKSQRDFSKQEYAEKAAYYRDLVTKKL